MSYDWEDESDQSVSRLNRFQRWLGRRVRNSARYLLVGIAILAAWNFLAPFAGVPAWAPYMEVLPQIAAPTEADMAIVNATHIVVMLAATAVAMRV